MAAIKPPPHALLIDCPPSRHDGGAAAGRQQQQRRGEWRNNPACRLACCVGTLLLAAAVLITGITLLVIFLGRKFPSKDPVFTVAITAVDGLDPAALVDLIDDDPPPSSSSSSPSPSPSAAADYDDYYISTSTTPPPPQLLSPVFYLAFEIDNTRNADHGACVPGLSRAEVSYGDAFLGGGSVPPFCARKMRASGAVAARAWAQSVAVPEFLREQLAQELVEGRAAVDVRVTMPSFCQGGWCDGRTAVLSCRPTIGGGTSPPCRVDFP